MDQSYITAIDIEKSSWEDINAFTGAKVGPNTWMTNQTSQNQLPHAAFTQATTSSGVNTNMQHHANYIPSAQPRTSRCQTKNEIDKAYRERLKENKKKMEDDINELSKENAQLKSKNEYLIEVTSTTNKSSQSASAEKKKLEKDICVLSREIKSLQKSFDSYSQRLVNSNHDHQSELIELKNKISILRQNSNRNAWKIEKPQLGKEIANLEHQNKVLKVQVEVLSDINTDKDFEEKQNMVVNNNNNNNNNNNDNGKSCKMRIDGNIGDFRKDTIIGENIESEYII